MHSFITSSNARKRIVIAAVAVALVTGSLGLTHANAASSTSDCTKTTLRSGDSNGCVVVLKEYLNAKMQDGYFTAPYKRNFADRTEAQVRAFQAKFDLESKDGVVGPETWAALTGTPVPAAKKASRSTERTTDPVPAPAPRYISGFDTKTKTFVCTSGAKSFPFSVTFDVDRTSGLQTLRSVSNTNGGGLYVTVSGSKDGFGSFSSATVTPNVKTGMTAAYLNVDLASKIGARSECHKTTSLL